MPEVKCINKTDRPNPWERIRNIGGVNADGTRWRLTQAEAVVAIENNTYGEFYVEQPRGDRVGVIVAVSRFGNKYVKTTADGDEPNNLLALPECP
jgi:hypothetical protein